MAWIAAALGGALLLSWGACFAASLLVPGPDLAGRPPQPARRGARAGRGGAPHPREGTGDPGAGRPEVSVVVPMRDEAANASGCIGALRAQGGVDLELIVVDDGSRDGTAALAASALSGWPAGRVVAGAPLPHGWVGKSWACHQGAQQASGRWLAFVDADVRLAPSALARLLADAEANAAQVLSGVGRQELGSAWERIVNPVVFLFIASLTPLPLARRPGSRVVAVNGQLLLFRRSAYDALGGHAGVRDAVVEDLALGRAAKERYGRGYRFVWARDLLSTRMYTSFGALWEGWSKNVALGAAAVGIPPPVVVAGALLGGVGPWLALLALPVAPAALWPGAAAALCQAAAVGTFTRRFSGEPAWWGATAPLGTAVVLGLTLSSWRATRAGALRWRGRSYRADR